MGGLSALDLIVRMVVSLGVVIGLMTFLGRWLRAKAGISLGKHNGQDAPLDVLARKPLGRASSVAIVRAGDKVIAVGITEERVTHLADLDPMVIELGVDEAGPSAETWTSSMGRGLLARSGQPRKSLLDQVKELTVRR